MSSEFLAVTSSSGCHCVLAVFLVADQPFTAASKVPKLEMSYQRGEVARTEWFGNFFAFELKPQDFLNFSRVPVSSFFI